MSAFTIPLDQAVRAIAQMIPSLPVSIGPASPAHDRSWSLFEPVQDASVLGATTMAPIARIGAAIAASSPKSSRNGPPGTPPPASAPVYSSPSGSPSRGSPSGVSSGQGPPFHCAPCKKTFASQQTWAAHEKSGKHRDTVKKLGREGAPPVSPSSGRGPRPASASSSASTSTAQSPANSPDATGLADILTKLKHVKAVEQSNAPLAATVYWNMAQALWNTHRSPRDAATALVLLAMHLDRLRTASTLDSLAAVLPGPVLLSAGLRALARLVLVLTSGGGAGRAAASALFVHALPIAPSVVAKWTGLVPARVAADVQDTWPPSSGTAVVWPAAELAEAHAVLAAAADVDPTGDGGESLVARVGYIMWNARADDDRPAAAMAYVRRMLDRGKLGLIGPWCLHFCELGCGPGSSAAGTDLWFLGATTAVRAGDRSTWRRLCIVATGNSLILDSIEYEVRLPPLFRFSRKLTQGYIQFLRNLILPDTAPMERMLTLTRAARQALAVSGAGKRLAKASTSLQDVVEPGVLRLALSRSLTWWLVTEAEWSVPELATWEAIVVESCKTHAIALVRP
ncbi:hypothetical protein BC828DRAFT_388757 [Blastocladiella britannica]|nr:hypothetical protein BC828DRAFT_388757 [Blastocladiella britannica]